MMNKNALFLLAVMAVLPAAHAGTIVYQDDFEDDTIGNAPLISGSNIGAGGYSAPVGNLSVGANPDASGNTSSKILLHAVGEAAGFNEIVVDFGAAYDMDGATVQFDFRISGDGGGVQDGARGFFYNSTEGKGTLFNRFDSEDSDVKIAGGVVGSHHGGGVWQRFTASYSLVEGETDLYDVDWGIEDLEGTGGTLSGSKQGTHANWAGGKASEFKVQLVDQTSGADIGVALDNFQISVETGSTTPLPIISSFAAVPPVLYTTNGTTALSWNTVHADYLEIDQGIGEVTGLNSTNVSPSETTTYSLIATNSEGSVTSSVTVTVQSQVFDAFAPRPNILYFYVDDMGWGAIGPNGQDARRAAGLASVKTPNIDSLAEAGVNFQRAYGCNFCSPARSSLMTGFHQGHTWADRNDPDNAKKAMRADDVTVGSALKAAGYATGFWGKWGFGGSDHPNNPVIQNRQTLPTEHGIDDVLAELHHVRAHTFFQPSLWTYRPGDSDIALIANDLASYENNPDYPEAPAFQSDAAYPSPAYCDDYYAFRALDFVRAQAQQYNADGTPFFANFSPQIPHSPYHEVDDLPQWDVYYTNDIHFPSLSNEARQWAAMVTRIDAHFGNILDALDDPNNDGDTSDSVIENTLVIFQSDNGGANNNGLAELGANDGLKSYKGSIWEGGIRVPMVMRWPAKITSNSTLQAGTDSQKVIDTTDMMPTFCELAGIDVPLGIDGVSLASFLTGRSGGRNREFVIHEAQPDRSIIRGNMKLVDDSGTLKLYDLGIDTNETTNIAASNAALVSELAALMYGEGVAEPVWYANTYHDWTGSDGADASDAGNWSDYIYSNRVNNIVYDTDDGAPRLSWVAKMHNDGSSGNEAVADSNLDFLGLEIKGAASNAIQSLTVSNSVVTGRNEIRLKPYSKVNLVGGTLGSLRWVDLYTHATIEGSGTIDAALYHEGHLRVTGAETASGLSVSGGTTNSLLTNGGFESGTGNAFNETDGWSNYGTTQTSDARSTSNPNSGSFRGILGAGSSGAHSPFVDTGHTIGSNEVYLLSFYHAGAWGWDAGADTITATLYCTNGGEQVLGSITVTPSQDFAVGYDFSGEQVFVATPAAAGQNLLLRFESLTADPASTEFGSIDDVVLNVITGATVVPAHVSTSRVCTITGDYTVGSNAVLDVTLAGPAMQGVDYAHVDVDGHAVLAGTLVVTVDAGFTPTAGDTFEILTADTLSGTFDHVDDLVMGSDGTPFTISYTGNVVTLMVTTLVTSNGTPYAWLDAYDLVTEGDYEAADLSDTDFDGYLAWQEYILGTVPTNGSSGLFPEQEILEGTNFLLRWASVSGRIYRVLHSPEMTQAFTHASGALPATPPENSWSTGTGTNQAFFRITTELE